MVQFPDSDPSVTTPSPTPNLGICRASARTRTRGVRGRAQREPHHPAHQANWRNANLSSRPLDTWFPGSAHPKRGETHGHSLCSGNPSHQGLEAALMVGRVPGGPAGGLQCSSFKGSRLGVSRMPSWPHLPFFHSPPPWGRSPTSEPSFLHETSPAAMVSAGIWPFSKAHGWAPGASPVRVTGPAGAEAALTSPPSCFLLSSLNLQTLRGA